MDGLEHRTKPVKRGGPVPFLTTSTEIRQPKGVVGVIAGILALLLVKLLGGLWRTMRPAPIPVVTTGRPEPQAS